MKLHFQQGSPSKTWTADIKSSDNIIKNLVFKAVLNGKEWDGKYPNVSYSGTSVIFTFGNAVTGSAQFEVVKGRTLGFTVFGGLA